MFIKIGRNDPCPCGSGKKFKKCCLGKSANAVTFRVVDPLDDPEYQKICKEIDEAESEMFSEGKLI